MRKVHHPETAAIASLTHDGRGIAAVDGKKVFVSGALPGETVRFERRKKRRNYDEAALLEVLDSSPDRVEARCAVFGTCGGCALQHLGGAKQREMKQRTLTDNLERIGGVAPERWLTPLHAENWHYRRRARLAVRDVAAKGRVLVGFRERHAPYVCDMHRCEILAHPVDALIDPLSELVGSLSIRRRVPQIEVAVGDDRTALVFRVLDPPGDDDLRALRAFADEHAVEVLLQSGGPQDVATLSGEPATPLEYFLPDFDLCIAFGPTDFVQVNGAVNRRLVGHATDLLDVDPSHRVLDLFCGIGNFTLPLARRGDRVLGIEGEAAQVERARQNARSNGIENCEFRVADLAAVDGGESWFGEGWDRLLLDPARSGAEALARSMARLGPSRIVYVSCHPGTLARDAGILVREQGYRLEAAGIVDMFPHTGHVESIAVFQKDS